MYFYGRGLGYHCIFWCQSIDRYNADYVKLEMFELIGA